MKQKTKKSKKLSFAPRVLKYTVFSLVTIVTVINSIAILQHWKYHNQHDSGNIGDLIVRAVENLSRPADIEPATGNVYLTTARLVLPPETLNVGRIQYNYAPSEGDFKGEAHVNRRMDVLLAESRLLIAENNNIKSMFDEVPKLQACSRGIRITYGESEGGISAGSKILKNGQTAYFYAEEECSNPELLAYVKQIDSY